MSMEIQKQIQNNWYQAYFTSNEVYII